MNKNNWQEILITKINKDWFILLIISLISLFLIIRQGYPGYLLQGETGFHFYPLESFKKSLFMWLEIRNGCTSITHNMTELPLTLFHLFLYKLQLSLIAINRLTFFLIPFLFGASTYYFSLTLLGKKYKYVRFMGLLASILSIFNYNVFGLIFAGGIRQGIAIPLSIYFLSFFIRFFSTKLPRYLLYMLFIAPFLNISIAFVIPIIIPIVLYTLLYITDNYGYKKTFSYIILGSAVLILINLWWILPFFNNALNSAKSIIPYAIDVRQTTNHGEATHNILRALMMKAGAPPGFMVHWLMNDRTFLLDTVLIIMSFSALLFIRLRKKSVFLSSCIIISAFLGVGSVPPYGFFYRILFNKLPLFAIFRDPNKFTIYISFYYSILIIILVICFFERVNLLKKNKKLKIVIKSAFVSGILFVSLTSSYPLITGNMLGNLTAYKIPDDYYQVRDYLAKKTNSNILILPFRPFYSLYSWHTKERYATTNLLIWFLSNSYIYNEFGDESLKGMNPIYPLVWNGLLLTSENYKIDKLNALLNIDYIIIQKDQLLPVLFTKERRKEGFEILEKNVVDYAQAYLLPLRGQYIELYRTKNKGLHIYVNGG